MFSSPLASSGTPTAKVSRARAIAAILRARDTIAEGSPIEAGGDENIRALARNLFSDHLFAFEFTSILLIVAVAGTVLLTRKEKRRGVDK